ncbi:MAG: hypothetical protein CMK59_15430 [Proteobacteria bacterium]|nr:hypothetical protein [Pseudomonadota bacterium]
MLIALFACSDYDLFRAKDENEEGINDSGILIDGSAPEDMGECSGNSSPAEEIGGADECTHQEGSFTPITEWTYGTGMGCLAMPVVADLDRDGDAEVILNALDPFVGGNMFNPIGSLTVLHGDGSGILWKDDTAQLGQGSTFAVGDINSDGFPEIIAVREYESGIISSTGIMPDGEYAVVAWDASGQVLWESEHYNKLHFDHAVAPIIADMNGDGTVEIIVGKVILNPDGTTRGIGALGRGSYGVNWVPFLEFWSTEATVPAVSDLDLDGQQEVIVGNGRYDLNGNTILQHQPAPGETEAPDGMISIANLDDDPQGEILSVTGNTLRAIDTDGSVMWGPIVMPYANILATVAVADLDNDGHPELVTAGGNAIHVLNHDGSTLWEQQATDNSGATGASIFDFEGDGIPEVVYIDEVQLVAFDGPTGEIKYQTDDHGSNTMFDYPVIVDVDGDDEAEVLVCHNGYTHALSVYGDENNSWMTARPLWNQHPYSITNIEENLSIPTNPEPSFSHSNTWHSAIAEPGVPVVANIDTEILDLCTEECDNQTVWLTIRVRNRGELDIGTGINITVYAQTPDGLNPIATTVLNNSLPVGWASESIEIELDANLLSEATNLWVVSDDNGEGTSLIQECSEQDNKIIVEGPFCD